LLLLLLLLLAKTDDETHDLKMFKRTVKEQHPGFQNAKKKTLGVQGLLRSPCLVSPLQTRARKMYSENSATLIEKRKKKHWANIQY
jgi:hypothetical protein